MPNTNKQSKTPHSPSSSQPAKVSQAPKPEARGSTGQAAAASPRSKARRDKLVKALAADDKKLEVKAIVKHGAMRGRKVTVLLDADDIVRDQVHGFVDFLREHAIVGLALGFVAGMQAQTVVKQLIESFISPTFVLLLGGTKLQERFFVLQFWGNEAQYRWGAMLYVIINLIFVLATVYALIKILKLDKLDKKT